MAHEILVDEDLAARAAGGDREAMGELFDRYFDQIYDFSLGIVRSPDTAGDVAQATFLKVMEHLRRKPPPRGFRAWLYTIARHTAIDELRRSRRLAPVPTLRAFDDDAPVLDPPAPAAWAEPERVVADQETVELVWEAAEGMNPDDRALLDLSLRKGLEPGEIAKVLGIASGAAYTRLSRAKNALEASVSALFLFRRGRQECQDLSTLIDRYHQEAMTPHLRKAINRHLSECDRCQQSRRRVVAAGALFGMVPLFVAPPRVHAGARDAVVEQSRMGAGDGAAGQAGSRTARTWMKAAIGLTAATLAAVALWWWNAAGGPAAPQEAVAAARIISFQIQDPAVGALELTNSPEVLLAVRFEGPAAAWLLAEDAAAPPPVDDPRWTESQPERFRLTPGDGPRTLFLWVRDPDGLTAGSQASILLDTTPPTPPANLQSSSHQPDQVTAQNVVTVTWSSAADPGAGSGLLGYAVGWDNPGEENPTEVSLGPDATRAVSPALPPGNWYFLIRAVDRAGNLGPLVRFGPFPIVAPDDVAGPTPPGETATAEPGAATEPAQSDPLSTQPDQPVEPAPAESEPAADEPSADEPPADEPPADEPPADEPPADEPPADEPPADEPPADEPPADEPPAGGETGHSPPAEPAPSNPRSLVAVRGFTLRDPKLGTPGVTSSPLAAVEARVEGEVKAWLLAVDSSTPPAPDDSRWLSDLPATLELGQGDGRRTVYLWLMDPVGEVVGTRTGILVDTVPPEQVAGLTSTTHRPGEPGQTAQVTVHWQAAADPLPGSGLAGYRVRWVAADGRVLHTEEVDAGVLAATSPVLPPGEGWYVELQARDLAGHLGPPARLGPFVAPE